MDLIPKLLRRGFINPLWLVVLLVYDVVGEPVCLDAPDGISQLHLVNDVEDVFVLTSCRIDGITTVRHGSPSFSDFRTGPRCMSEVQMESPHVVKSASLSWS